MNVLFKYKIILFNILVFIGSVFAGNTSYVTRIQTHFQLNGQSYYFTGTNCYYLMVYAADGGLRSYVDEVLGEASAMGLNVIRTWGFNDGASQWNALQTAPGVYDETVFQGLDYVLDKADQLNLRVILPLVNNWDDYGGMNQYVSWSEESVHERDAFVQVNGTHFEIDGQPYYYAGINFWSAMNLASAGTGGNRARLLRELDLLKEKGITVLRIMAGSEGPDTEPWRMVPALQTAPGVYDSDVLDGLDYLISAMKARDLRAVMCLTNFWPWSGGMAQYNNWNGGGVIPYPPPEPGGSWDDYANYTKTFYSNTGAMQDLEDHIAYLLNRVNPYTGLAYKNEPVVFSWELCNEPRGYTKATVFNLWIDNTAAYIKSLDANHLVTTGCEGDTPWPSWNGLDFTTNHDGSDIDYTTIHIWPQNWNWYDPANPGGTYATAESNARSYFNSHEAKAVSLGKPMVLEEFGLARNGESYDPSSAVTYRDQFFTAMFSEVNTSASTGGPAAGSLPWSWAGEGRPLIPYGSYWSSGDPWIGDPPHEKQGWYSIYDSDASTLQTIENHASQMKALCGSLDHDDFYIDVLCKQYYKNHISTVLNRVNTINGRTYREDPTVFAWELGNEPRCSSDPGGTTLNNWVGEMSAYIKTIDTNHLVTTGIEGYYNTGNPTGWMDNAGTDFFANHQHSAIDFATSHSWPDHWGWDSTTTIGYLEQQINDAHNTIGKPFVLGEFGKERDGGGGTTARDQFYEAYFTQIDHQCAGGALFWILYHDAYPDYDGFGVYYPADNSTVSIIETFADCIPCQENTVFLEAVGDVTTWPGTSFRWKDIKDNLYAGSYQSSFTYDQPSVSITFDNKNKTFVGTLNASGLKPNFGYQVKLVGKPESDWGIDGDDTSNEYIGFTGRWFRKQPDPGNTNDADYLAHKDDPAYIFEGYLLFDYFVTDENGNAVKHFIVNNSFHVLWNTIVNSRSPGSNDSEITNHDIIAMASNPAYETDYGETTVGLYAEWEPGRALPGKARLPVGHFDCQFILTEESYHQSGIGGYWASAMGQEIVFNVCPCDWTDSTDPVMESILESQGEYYSTAPVFSNFGFSDNTALNKIQYSFDKLYKWFTSQPGWYFVHDGVSGSSYHNDGWTLTHFTVLADQTMHTVTFRISDDAGNVSTSTTWQFYKDTGPPLPVENLTAMPGGSVDLSWDPPVGGWDSDFERLEIYRLDHPAGYPGYSGAEIYPDHSEPGNLVNTITEIATTSWRDPVEGLETASRNIYHYQLFVVDNTQEYSPENASARARATNYLPGDVASPSGYATPYDNTVDFDDLAVFSAAYGSSQGDPFYNAECDFGPTHENSRLGIPQPWSGTEAYIIDFEDLMIFAMNYHQVLTKEMEQFPSTEVQGDLSLELIKANDTGQEIEIDFALNNPGIPLKGIYAEIQFDPELLELQKVSSGEIFSTATRREFFHTEQKKGLICLSAALLGQLAGTCKSGPVSKLCFTRKKNENCELCFQCVLVRDMHNHNLEPELIPCDLNQGGFKPDQYSLFQNYPNPFNSSTLICYSLPTPGYVRLQIFNNRGQLIKVLEEKVVPEGIYQIKWNGKDENDKDVSTGIYFCQLNSEEYQKVIKMVFAR